MAKGNGGYRIKFVGRRFQDGRLPVGVLPDIEAFRSLLVSFAKNEWLRRHAGRKRVPKGFASSFSLDLVAIDRGSAVPRLDFSDDACEPCLPGFKGKRGEILESACGKIADLIDKVRCKDESLPALSRDQIAALRRFGSCLQSDESIEFIGRQGRDKKLISWNVALRRNLMGRIEETYEERYIGFGYLDSISVGGDIVVKTQEHGAVRVNVGERAKAEFDGSLLADVTLDVTLELDASEHVRAVRNVRSVDLHDMAAQEETVVERSSRRIRELRELSEGWLGEGEGAPVSEIAADRAEFLIRERPLWFALSGIFPTPEGGVQIETEKRQADVTITIDPQGDVAGSVISKGKTLTDEDLNDRGEVMSALERFS